MYGVEPVASRALPRRVASCGGRIIKTSLQQPQQLQKACCGLAYLSGAISSVFAANAFLRIGGWLVVRREFTPDSLTW